MIFKHKWFVSFILVVLLFAMLACNKEKKTVLKENAEKVNLEASNNEKPALPEGHPPVSNKNEKPEDNSVAVKHPGINTLKEVRVGDEIKVKWKTVKIKLVNVQDGKEETLTLDLGKGASFEDAGFTLKIEAYVPHYLIYDTYIGSKSNEPVNPAILVVLTRGEETITKGWIFEKFPQFNSFKHEKYHITLLPSELKG